METLREVHSLEELEAYFQVPGFPVTNIALVPYGYDDRIRWDTYLVTGIFADGACGVLGMTDGPLPDSKSFRTL